MILNERLHADLVLKSSLRYSTSPAQVDYDIFTALGIDSCFNVAPENLLFIVYCDKVFRKEGLEKVSSLVVVA